MIKYMLVITLVGATLSAPQYNPFTFQNAYKGYNPFQPFQASTPTPILRVVPVTAAPRYYSSADSQTPILKEFQDINEDGSYQYGYETGNGISVQEQGVQKSIGNNVGTAAQGSYSYTSPEGKLISISYVADENGFRAVGDAIPTPPPVPPAIQRALEYIARSQNLARKLY